MKLKKLPDVALAMAILFIFFYIILHFTIYEMDSDIITIRAGIVIWLINIFLSIGYLICSTIFFQSFLLRSKIYVWLQSINYAAVMMSAITFYYKLNQYICLFFVTAVLIVLAALVVVRNYLKVNEKMIIMLVPAVCVWIDSLMFLSSKWMTAIGVAVFFAGAVVIEIMMIDFEGQDSMYEQKNEKCIGNNHTIITRKGGGHLFNQDYARYEEKDEITVVALADGAGSYLYAREGAECVVNHITKYMYKNVQTLMLESEDNIAYNISCEIAHALNCYCKTHDNVKKEMLGSTLLLVCKYKEKYIAIHLGDGLIGAVTADKEIKVLSYPQNGITRQYTYLTTSSDLLKYLRVYKGICNQNMHGNDEIHKFFLITDGFMNICYDWSTRCFDKEFVNYLIEGNYKEVEERICSLELFDDSTLLVLEI